MNKPVSSEVEKIEFPSWFGELGWEVMSWIPFCRKKAENYNEVIASSFADMAPLYNDFVTEFHSNHSTTRSLDYPKIYKVDGKYFKYGRPEKAEVIFDILIHARGISRKSNINYCQWEHVVKQLKGLTYAFIGTKRDQYVNGGGIDLRDIELQKLMDMIARAKLVIGSSSGIMHLAAACGTNLVVWGDGRTYFSETLEQRYKVTWNPFEVQVGWIKADDWQPKPEDIIRKIEHLI